MPSLLGGHPGTGGFPLFHVNVLVHLLLRGNGGENQLWPESTRDPAEHSASPGWPTGRDRRPSFEQSILPKRNVSLLHLRQVGVDFDEAGIRFTGRHRAILRGTVDFVLPVLEVSPRLVTVGHRHSLIRSVAQPRAGLGPGKFFGGRRTLRNGRTSSGDREPSRLLALRGAAIGFKNVHPLNGGLDATLHAARITRPAPETASSSGRRPSRMIGWPFTNDHWRPLARAM